MNYKEWLKGNSKQQHMEHISYAIMIVSAALIGFGLLIGSFVYGLVYISAFGAFALLIGIVVYIASQMMEQDKV